MRTGSRGIMAFLFCIIGIPLAGVELLLFVLGAVFLAASEVVGRRVARLLGLDD